jgi:nitrite reductase/ring-hydroxylating ferredoxin subunit
MGTDGIYVFKTADGLRGVERHCPHEGALLAKATLLGGGRMLKCPLHNFVFRLSDGVAVNCPGYRLRVFEVREEVGQLFARPLVPG